MTVPGAGVLRIGRTGAPTEDPPSTANAPLIDPTSALGRPAPRTHSRRDVLRFGIIGAGGLVIGGLTGFAIGRSTAPTIDAAHPIVAPPVDVPLPGAAFPIVISDTARGFVDAEVQPFFYLADTAWNAISRMTREAFETLATARRDSGFTALQLSVLDFRPTAENAYGHVPFNETGQLDSPELAAGSGEDYWTHVDWAIDLCRELGLLVCLVPAWYGGWGDAWRGYVTEDNAREYGAFLADRYGDRDNVWWLLGGDNDPDASGDSTSGVPGKLDRGPRIAETKAMGRALLEGATVPQLMSYHTGRRMTVEEYFGEDEWYAISAAYSDEDPVPYVTAEYARETIRPVVVWEAYYAEREAEPVLDRRAVRAQAYHALFSGAAGFAYGHEDVWRVRDGWIEALEDGTSDDIGILATLLAEFGTDDLVPLSAADGTLGLLPDGYGTAGTTSAVSAASLPQARGALAYFGEPRISVRIDTTALEPTAAYEIRWLNPETGEEFFVGADRSGADITIGWPSTWTDAVLIVKR